jgi:phage tail sheath gpL-like
MSSNPRVTATIFSADTGVKLNAHKLLITGQKTASGTATSGSLQTQIITESQVNELFGRKSHIAKKLRAVLKNLSISRIKPQIDAIALADNGTTKANGGYTFTGPATENGIVTAEIDSEINGSYSVSVENGDSATVIAGKLVALITANANANYTAANTAGVVTITAENAGTNGNTIRLGFKGSVAGVTVTKSGEYLTGGATDPVLTGLFDSVDSIQYQTIDYPSTWNLATLASFTEPRFNVENDILYSQGFTFKVDTYSNLNTLLDGLNYKTVCVGFDKLGGGIFENPDVINSQFCAYRGLLFTDGANVSSINSGNGQETGGATWASLPYFNMPFINLPVIPQGENFSKEELEELEKSGGWTFENNNANTRLLLRTVKSTYKTNDLGDPDPTFGFLNYIDSLTISREYFFKGIKQTYPRHRITNALTAPAGAKAIVTKASFLGTLGQFYDELVKLAIFEKDRKVEFLERAGDTINFDLLNGKITSDVLAPITTQLREVILSFIPKFN